jgi:hypothetical protein
MERISTYENYAQLVEQLWNDKNVVKEAQANNTTADVDATKTTQYAKALIKPVFQSAVIVDLFQPVIMKQSSLTVPIFNVTRDGVTTAEVAENGQIQLSKVNSSTSVINAVKFALRSSVTTELLEDSKNNGKVSFDPIGMALANDARYIVSEIDGKLYDLLYNGATAGIVYWDTVAPSGWATDHPGKDYDLTFELAIKQAVAKVAAQKYAADFILINPEDEYRMSNIKGFVPSSFDVKTDLHGIIGKLGKLTVYSSAEVRQGIAIIGQKNVLGVYGTYIPFQYKAGVYDSEYDTSEWVVRTRVAMKVIAGEAIAKVYLVTPISGEAVGTGDGSKTAFNLAHYPVKPGSLTIKLGSTVTTDYSVDLETGVLTFNSAPGSGVAITADYSAVL